MHKNEKIRVIQYLMKNAKHVDSFIEEFQKMGDLKHDYNKYMITAPIDCNLELKRVIEADYELCSALMTMLFREDHFDNGSFAHRLSSGDVNRILLRMLEILSADKCAGNIMQWNSKAWLQAYKAPGADYRELNRQVYQSTVKAVLSGSYELESGNIVRINSAPDMAERTVFYHKRSTPLGMEKYDTAVEFFEGDCLVAARKTLEEEKNSHCKVACLNMASASNPGGGVYNGAGAQEEYLFRCSDYFKSLYQFVDYCNQYQVERNRNHSYPLDRNYGGVYSPDVTVFRGPVEEGYPFLAEPFKMNFIAVAGVNRPHLNAARNRIVGVDRITTENKLRTILDIALDNGIEVLILGAIGCGAFKNPPEHIALMFKELLEQKPYYHAFKRVIFAIKQDHNSVGRGQKKLIEVFRDVFERHIST